MIASPNTVSPVLSALRAATASQHARLEQAMPLSNTDAGRSDYVAYARAMLGWMAPLEVRLWSADCPAALAPAERDVKADWLRNDLLSLGVAEAEIARLPRCTALPAVDTHAERVGVAYVVEGSQLGGQVLLRRLGPSLAPHVPRYLVGYGAETGPRWKRLLVAMAELVTTPDEIARAAHAAQRTFGSLEEWFTARGAA